MIDQRDKNEKVDDILFVLGKQIKKIDGSFKGSDELALRFGACLEREEATNERTRDVDQPTSLAGNGRSARLGYQPRDDT